MSTIEEITKKFIDETGISDKFLATAVRYYAPCIEALCEAATDYKTQNNAPLFFGLVGCQGSGKTTLGEYISSLANKFGCRVLVMSIDDFYLSRAERKELSETVHPLLATRGAPGTHNTKMLKEVLLALKAGESGFVRPQFNKATDDCLPQDDYPMVNQSYDLIILEGWFWGAMPADPCELEESINALEEHEDKDARWRSYVNRSLEKDYVPLYELFDYWGFLKAPAFSSVLSWRAEQEEKLAKSAVGRANSGVMTKEEIERFIQHYQRITEQLLKDMPKRADIVWHLDSDRKIKTMKIKGDLARKVWTT